MSKYIYLFAGQGSQSIGMGKDFFENSQVAKELIEEASDRLKINFKALMFEQNDILSETEFTQPSILLVGAIAYKLFTSFIKIKPSYVLGHSLGEFSSLIVSNAIDIMDCLELVHFRGKLMKEACSKEKSDVGMLVCLGLQDDIVEQICTTGREKKLKVWTVNYNTDGQIVIAGVKKDLNLLTTILKKNGAKRAIILDMSVASHCPLLESAIEPLYNKIDELVKDNFEVPIISNVTAKAYQTKEKAVELLSQQLVKPVLYKQSILGIDNQADLYIEFGNKNILQGLNRKLSKKPHFSISNMKSLEDTIKSVETI